MSLSLPPPVAAFFTADRVDGDAVARCFTEQATVTDEGHVYQGRDAIRRWRAEAGAKYIYVAEPIAVAHEGERIIVTSRLTGNFPGSPTNLAYAFTLEDGAISRLEIAP